MVRFTEEVLHGKLHFLATKNPFFEKNMFSRFSALKLSATFFQKKRQEVLLEKFFYWMYILNVLLDEESFV